MKYESQSNNYPHDTNQDISQIKGIIKLKRRSPVSLREMKKAIREAATNFIK